MSHLILSILGPDRPGLVDVLSATVRDHGGNWLESQMAKLAGHFAGVVRVAVPPENAGALEDALRALTDQGLIVTTTPAPDADPLADAPPIRLALSFLGHDRPGIVRDIAHALAVRGLNITELTSRVTSAPMSGEPIFHATATLAAPPDTDVDQLEDQLEALADAMSLDLTLTRTENKD